MKILHIAPIGHHSEGIGSVLKELIPHQTRLGAEVRVISVYENKIYPDLEITTINDVNSFLSYIANWRPDFVLFHSVYKKQFIMMYKVLLKQNIPYGIQMHGGLSEENYRKNHLKKIVANFFYFNKFMRNARSIVYLSDSEYERCIVKRINPKKIIIPNGISTREIDVNIPLPSDKIEIIFVGRISMQVKGLDRLIEAINILECHSDLHFSIYGNEDDAHTSILKDIIKGKENIVEYRGGLYGKEKDLIFRKANIYILTSPSEGMPVGVLEAFSYGVPCIVTPGTNMASVIEKHNAGWVAKYDSTDIARIIETAITEYRVDQLSFRNNAYALSKDYSWEHVARVSIDSINKLLS